MQNRRNAAERVKDRYARAASFYDLLENLSTGSNEAKWRRTAWGRAEGSNVLEVGVGTGRNFPYYPAGLQITGIDFSENMLKRARDKSAEQNTHVQLILMDIQNMEFADNTFDSVVGTFVFCTVPDPIRGLSEVWRVLKPGGKLVLLEHVLSENRATATVMNLVNPVVWWVFGGNINRRTAETVAKCGFAIEQVSPSGGADRLIEARRQL